MSLDFDLAKDAINQAKHGISLADAARLDWDLVLAKPDMRSQYGEPRQIGYGPIGSRLYCVVFVDRGETAASSAFGRLTAVRSTATKPKLLRPTKAEDARIAAGIAADRDTYELSDAEFGQLRPLRGRPKLAAPKQRITIRLSSDVLAKFKAVGSGWQTRIDLALRDWLKGHRVR